jgi:GT2 family glycosyltransferase
LESIDEAKPPVGASVQVCVVDNGATDGTRDMLHSYSTRSRRYPVTVLDQPLSGKSSALNRALVSTNSDLTLVLDDDVIVDELCLEKHVELYRTAQFAAVQGRVLPGKDASGRDADPSRIREYNIPVVDYGEQIGEIQGLTGTNMSFKREVIDKIGLFDPRLGPGASGFSEDTEFSLRIRKAGFKIGYTPYAIVYHELNPDRFGREYHRRVEYRKGVSRSIYRNDSIAFRVIPDLLANCLRYGLYRLFGKAQKAYKTEGKIMKCWGYVMGKIQYRPGSIRHGES